MANRALRCCWRLLTSRGKPPLPRSSHTVTSVNGRVLVFGGEDKPRNAFDPHVYALSLGAEWKQVPAPAPTGPLLGHGAAGLGSHLYIFGGRTGGPNDFGGSGSAGETGDLLIFDADAGAWQWKKPSAHWPERRSFHAMCASASSEDGYVYVFGGCGASGRLNDLWRLDTQEGSWSCLHRGGPEEGVPKPRGGAAIVAGRDKLVLLFGFDGTQRGEIAVFDLARNVWEVIPQEAQRGDVPLPRSVFCAAAARGPGVDGHAILFGGESEASSLGHEGAGAFVDDVYSLHVDDLQWTKHNIEGERPEPRGWTGLAASGDNRMMLFGGLNASNTRLGDVWELEVS